ncbi:hypothetical protein BGZ82_005467, partial [Podila clonocystis]
RTMPVLISIMFGKSSEHYKQHFMVLFKGLPFKSWEEFQEGFVGMTCDFSEAERRGFEKALCTHYSLSEEDFDKVNLERHYRY